MKKENMIEDGFGSVWKKCGSNCSLHVVRPGKTDCNCTGKNCPNKKEVSNVSKTK